MARKKKHNKATGLWALDSGAFTEISKFGRWETSAKEYVEETLRWSEQIAVLDFAGVQDWMCEPHILKKTGLSVNKHQVRTLESYFELKELAPSVNWVPTLQGWKLQDYLNHADMYYAAGISLHEENTVAVGSVCRRQGMDEATEIIRELSSICGLNIHAYGFKINGLQKCGKLLKSSDSMAWSLNARYNKPLEGCTHKNCANCLKYALKWRHEKIMSIDTEF